MSTVIKPFGDLITTTIKPDKTGGFRIWSGTLTQSGTSAPVATVQENNIGDIAWYRSAVGVYNGTLSGAFVNGKTTIDIGQSATAVSGTTNVQANRISQNAIEIQSGTDGVLTNQLVTIKIYS